MRFGELVRRVVASAVLALAGVGVAVAAGPVGAIDLPSLPTVTVPTVTVPTLPVTTPTVSLPTPAPPPPPSTAPPSPPPTAAPPPPAPPVSTASRSPAAPPSASGPSTSGAQPARVGSKQAPAHSVRLPRANGRDNSTAPVSTLGAEPTRSSASGKTASGALHAATPVTHDSGLLGAPVSRLVPGSRETQLALLIVLAAATFLLGVGAVPRQVIPHPGAAALIARYRPLVAAAGLFALTAFLVSYFVA